jgi:hypothetical protein
MEQAIDSKISVSAALEKMRGYDNGAITATVAEQILNAFGSSLEKLGITPRTVAEMGGFAYPGHENTPSVQADRVVIGLSIALGLQTAAHAYQHPYTSNRRNAEVNISRAVRLLEQYHALGGARETKRLPRTVRMDGEYRKALGSAVRSQHSFDHMTKAHYDRGWDCDYPSGWWMKAKNWKFEKPQVAVMR